MTARGSSFMFLVVFCCLGAFSSLLAQATAINSIAFNGSGNVDATFVGNAAASGAYTFVYKANGTNGATTSHSGILPAGVTVSTVVTSAGSAYALVTVNNTYYITYRVQTYTCTNGTTSWNQQVYTGPSTNPPPAVQSFSASSGSLNAGSQVTIAGTVGDANSNLTSVTIDYLAPGSSTWVIGTTALGTAWSGAATGSHSISNIFTLNVIGTWSFRISGQDALGAITGYTQTSVNSLNNVPTVQSLSATPTSVLVGRQVTVNGSVGDADANLTSVSIDYLAPGSSIWVAGTAGAGTAWSGSATGSRSLSYNQTLSTVGTWTIRISGTDALGAQCAYTQITVNATNAPPMVQTLNASSSSVLIGSAVTINGTVNDSDANLTSASLDYQAPGSTTWIIGSAAAGTAWTGAATNTKSLSPSLTLNALGTWNIRLSGQDTGGATSGYTSITIMVHDYYNGVQPSLTTLQGNNAYGVTGQFNSQPFMVKIANPTGNTPFVNAPVTVTVLSGAGYLSQTNGAGTATVQTLSLTTDANGNIQFYYLQPGSTTAVSTLQVTAGTATSTLTTYAYSASEAANDPDGDGIVTVVETVLGTNPNQAAQTSTAPALNVYTP